MDLLTQFAASSQESIFQALGIDWKTLLLQMVAFLILVWLLAKFVYPWLMKSVDERQASIEAGQKAAEEAEAKAKAVEAEIADMLRTARQEASEIVVTAKDEAQAVLEAAELKAKDRADHIIHEAHEQLEKDIAAAREALKKETLSLVTLATEKVVGSTLTASLDTKVMAASLKDLEA